MQFSNGRTALLMAHQNGHIDIVKYVIKANANDNLQGSDCNAARLMAAKNTHTEIVKFLKRAIVNKLKTLRTGAF